MPPASIVNSLKHSVGILVIWNESFQNSSVVCVKLASIRTYVKRYHQNKQNASKSSRYKIMSFSLQSLFEQGCWVNLVLKFWDKGCWDFEIASGILLRLIDAKSNTWSITSFMWKEVAHWNNHRSIQNVDAAIYHC